MIRIRLVRVIAIFLMSAAMGCDAEGEPNKALVTAERVPNLPELSERLVLASKWDTLFILGDVNDSLVLNPSRLASHSNGVLVFDRGSQSLYRLTSEGALDWRTGREGGGPGEFRRVRCISTRGSKIFLFDSGNQRVSQYTSAGRLVNETMLAGYAGPECIVPLSDGRFILRTMDPEQPIVLVDQSGVLVRPIVLPWEGMSALHPLAAQFAVAGGGGERWVLAFYYGEGWFVYSGTEPTPVRAGYLERTKFPAVLTETEEGGVRSRIVSRPIDAIVSLAVDEERVHMLFGGESDEAGRWIDSFDLASGNYVGSALLPDDDYSALAVDGEVYYLISRDPFPQIIALTPAWPH